MIKNTELITRPLKKHPRKKRVLLLTDHQMEMLSAILEDWVPPRRSSGATRDRIVRAINQSVEMDVRAPNRKSFNVLVRHYNRLGYRQASTLTAAMMDIKQIVLLAIGGLDE